jgi:hypothetical protein
MPVPPPVIIVRDEWGNVVAQWEPSADLWLDMQAFAAACDISIDQLVDRALTAYVHEHPPSDARRI